MADFRGHDSFDFLSSLYLPTIWGVTVFKQAMQSNSASHPVFWGFIVIWVTLMGLTVIPLLKLQRAGVACIFCYAKTWSEKRV
jgi:uncharacterized protein (DUF983 family)